MRGADTHATAGRRHRRRIVILTDAAQVHDDDREFRGLTRRSRATLEWKITEALQWIGAPVSTIAFDTDVPTFSRRLETLAPRLVFNLTEEAHDERRFDANIAGLLELLRVRYTGAGPAGLVLGRDKAASKMLLQAAGLRVPAFCVIAPGGRISGTLPPFPAIVKPVFGDGSDGVSARSRVRSAGEMLARAAFVHRRFRQPAICEQQIVGRELLSFVVGNRRQRLLTPVEIMWAPSRPRHARVASYHVKHDPVVRRRTGMYYAPARLTYRERLRLAEVTIEAFRVLAMRDYGKVDLMLDDSGEYHVIEGNPNPCLESKARSLERSGGRYRFRHLVRDIVQACAERAP